MAEMSEVGELPLVEDSDADLYAKLVAADFCGATWDYLADRFARYGYQWLGGWIRSGKIVALCLDAGIRSMPTGLVIPDDDVEDLVQETVVEGIAEFRRRGLAGIGWQAALGASLNSYYIGGCFYAFAKHHRKYQQSADLRATTWMGLQCQARSAPDVPDVADVVDMCSEVRRRLAGVPDWRTRCALKMQAAGYTLRDIAGELSLSERAVEGLLYRFRKNTLPDTDGGSS